MQIKPGGVGQRPLASDVRDMLKCFSGVVVDLCGAESLRHGSSPLGDEQDTELNTEGLRNKKRFGFCRQRHRKWFDEIFQTKKRRVAGFF